MEEEVSYGVINLNTVQEKLKGLSGSEIRLLLLMVRDAEFPNSGRNKVEKVPGNLSYIDPAYRLLWSEELDIRTAGGLSNMIKALLEKDCIRKYQFKRYIINPEIVFKGATSHKQAAVNMYNKLNNGNQKSDELQYNYTGQES